MYMDRKKQKIAKKKKKFLVNRKGSSIIVPTLRIKCIRYFCSL